MTFFISKKEGFHEDEIYSYGSSNYKYDNVFQPHGKIDYISKTIKSNILDSPNPLKKTMYYLFNSNDFMTELDKTKSEEIPIWKTKEDANEYMTIQKEDVFNFFSIYINQSRDANPPLFYFLVHIICTIFFNSFSKYYIFIINLIAFIGCTILIKKILTILHKQQLSIPVLLLYGLSIGGISTVIFQRMYMLLTYFILHYTYINLKILKSNFELTMKLKKELGIITILGFLTQYYFCVYAIFIFFVMILKLYKEHRKNDIKTFIIYNIKLAFIGVLLFPASIYHIFFSYRGVSGFKSYTPHIFSFIELIFNAYSVNIILGFLFLCFIIVVSIIMSVKFKNKIISLLLLPCIGYTIIVSKISPYIDMRYIMGILPIISILFVVCLNFIFKKRKLFILAIFSIIITIYSTIVMLNTSPLYLYSGYDNYLKIAKENSNLNFIYVEDNGFNHIQSMKEFMIYNKSLIININNDELKYIKNNESLENETACIVSIKEYLDEEKIINKILEYTQFNKCEILLNYDIDTGCIIYKISK